MTATLTGMRMGEILAMKWEHLDWNKKIYTVKESYSPFGFDTPKTESSYRIVELSQALMEILREHRKTQLRIGQEPKSKGLIFCTEAGTPINPSNLRNRIFYPALKKAGLFDKKIRFHDLRGVYATLLLESGALLKYVQEQLGHKTPAMTLGVYAKVTLEARQQAQERFQSYFFG